MLRYLPAILIPLGLPILTLVVGQADTPTIVFTVVLSLTVAAISAYGLNQTLVRQLQPIQRTLDLLRANILTLEQAKALKDAQGDDPLVDLQRRVGLTAEDVIKREMQLRHQVVELQVVIDQHQKETTVEQIVSSDFFQDLQKRAKDWRKND